MAAAANQHRFDQVELDRLLGLFEQAGPARPEGAEDFCEGFEAWIADGLAPPDKIDGFKADLLFIRGMLDTARGDYEQAIDHLHHSIAVSKNTGKVKRQIFGLCAIATCYEYSGMQSESSGCILEALDLAEDLGEDPIHFAVLHSLTYLYQAQGAFELMLESGMRALAITERLNDRQLELRTCSAISLAYGYLDRAEEGLEWLQRGLDLIDSDTPRHVQTLMNLNLMWLNQRCGRLDVAVALAEANLDQLANLPAQHAAMLYVDIAELQLEVGDLDRASEMLAFVDGMSNAESMKAHQMSYYRVAADLHEARGEPAEALRMLRSCIVLEEEFRGRQAQTRLVALERHFAADLVAKTDEVHHLRTVELVEKNRQLSDLIHQKDEILHVVVHDLRNPLTAARLLSEMLMNDLSEGIDRDAADLVSSIQSATASMSESINQLLASQDAPHSTDPSAVNDIIELTLSDARDWAEASDVSLETSIDAVGMVADSALLRRAVGDVLAVAIASASPGSAVQMSVGASDDGTHIMIAGDGVGPRETLDGADGLYVARRLIERMNGALVLSPNDESGSFNATIDLRG